MKKNPLHIVREPSTLPYLAPDCLLIAASAFSDSVLLPPVVVGAALYDAP